MFKFLCLCIFGDPKQVLQLTPDVVRKTANTWLARALPHHYTHNNVHTQLKGHTHWCSVHYAGYVEAWTMTHKDTLQTEWSAMHWSKCTLWQSCAWKAIDCQVLGLSSWKQLLPQDKYIYIYFFLRIIYCFCELQCPLFTKPKKVTTLSCCCIHKLWTSSFLHQLRVNYKLRMKPE